MTHRERAVLQKHTQLGSISYTSATVSWDNSINIDANVIMTHGCEHSKKAFEGALSFDGALHGIAAAPVVETV